ncbi:HDL096Cp [Eremothecium sinecaudum]|uniref:HDL096Cp n=1 Tax=Eremothecium sinecaudum TaxID=45286 RepID=A0A0X8HSL7_9SACH|nr:HDL096Cp [Eremothecium sinecaudum]AMD20648.1 HDL096Cp [Eremothecium sinecaudum]
MGIVLNAFRLRLSVLVRLFKGLLLVLTFLAVVSNLYIFTYPSLNPGQCSWKCHKTDKPSPADSLPRVERYIHYVKRYLVDVKDQTFKKKPSLDSDAVPDVHLLALADPQLNGNWPHTSYAKRLDHFGNDYYLGHVFRMMKNRLAPSHVAIMGDLFSSQWIGDYEFFKRTVRLTRRLLGRRSSRLEEIKEKNHDEQGHYKADGEAFGRDIENRLREKPVKADWSYENVWAWSRGDQYLLMNLTGNHDVGYSGDCSYQHMARFHELVGKDNYWIEYDRGTVHSWRIVVLNDVLLEGPALQPELLNMTWEFLYQVFERRFDGSTVLLTHIPFYKEKGMCVDDPEFTYYPADYNSDPSKANLLRSQNHLSKDVTNRVLSLIFDNNKPGIILAGHDHEGCEAIYNKDDKLGIWNVSRSVTSEDLHIKEITIRSVMASYGGNAGLLTGHFDAKEENWQWNFSLCPFAVQHIWWFAKISTIITGLAWFLILVRSAFTMRS